MDANKILNTNLLDIVFERKNKAYGAYELRKSYNKRISIALFSTVLVIAILLIVGSAIANSFSPKNIRPVDGPDVVIHQTPPVEPPSPPPPVYHPPPPLLARIAYPPPLIVKDKLVIKPPPDVQQLIDARIDLKTVEGNNDVGIVALPADIKESQVMAAVADKKKDGYCIY